MKERAKVRKERCVGQKDEREVLMTGEIVPFDFKKEPVPW